MRKLALTLTFALITGITHAASTAPYTHSGITTRDSYQPKNRDINWVTVESIRKSLEGVPPINVSFDIDDTVSFSSACFHYGKMKYSPNSDDYLNNQAFWDDINADCDRQYSIPKQIAVELIQMHQQRGDQVYFFTGRPAGKVDGVTPTLEKTLHVKNMQPVEFMGGRKRNTAYNKTPAIIAHHVQIHYGDSDDDVLAAKEAGVRGIRLLRSANSQNLPLPQAGGYGEEVLINSDY